MSKFECKNCGFIVEQEVQPESCPLCGEHDFNVSGGTQAGATVSAASEPVRAAEPAPAPAASRNSYVQFREFPMVQRDRVKKDLEDKLEEIQQETQAFVGTQEAKIKKKSDKESSVEGIAFMFTFMIGLFATCCGSCYVCASDDGFSRGFGSVIQTIFAGLFITVIVSVGITFLMGTIVGTKKKDFQNIDARKNTAEEDKKKRQEEARRSISEYAESFDRAVKDTVQWFASNKTTEEIGDRILGSFVDAIERAPRDASTKDISVACQYSVYANQVQYGGGIFSFSQNHCSSLAGPVEQAALAQAIAAYLEIRVLEKYEKDPCGSVPQIRIDIADNAAARTITVTYKAANVNYRGI